MYLSELKIKGYKTFKDKFKIKFNEGLTILVGENGSGKTTIIDAIRLLLNEDEYGRIGISNKDFFRAFDKPAKDKGVSSIEINGVFNNLDSQEQVAFLPWLDATDNKAAYLNIKIENKQSPRGRYNRVVWGGESVSGIFEWDLIDILACIYLPPLRDAGNKLEAYRGSRLSRLFRNEKPESGTEHPLETKVQELNDELVKTDAIRSANDQINEYLKKSLGSFLGQNALIQFSETSFDRIVEKLRILFYPKINSNPDKDQFREISENSLGYNNVLYLATVLAELDRAKDCLLKVLLIEEPEAHLHPQLQVRLMQYLQDQSKESGIQIIVTTHSPTITSSANLDSLNILTFNLLENPKSTLIKDCEVESNSKFFLERWLDVTKSTLFFAKGVILVEGIAEAIVLKELAKRVFKETHSAIPDAPKTLDDYGVSIINLNGIYFKHFFQLFQGYKNDTKKGVDFIPIRCAGLTDCDPKCLNAECKPTKKLSCGCRNHQYYLIDELEANSSFCRLFSNLKTFEYDLALEGENLKVMLEIFDNWLDTSGLIKKEIEKNLAIDWSKQDEEIKANIAFKLLHWVEKTPNKAKKVLGKGEFAQLLALKIHNDPAIPFSTPEYIRNAFYWAIKFNLKNSQEPKNEAVA